MIFEDLVFDAPLNPLMTLILFLGLVNLTRRFTPKVHQSPEIFVSTFFGVLTFFCTFLLLSIPFNFLKAPIFKWGLYTLLIFSFLELIALFKTLKKRVKWPSLQNYGTKEKALLVIALGSLTSMFFLSLAPPTDADSLRYHLGLPAKILVDGAFYPTEWFHQRVFGHGEILNLLGLIFGTDCFGSFLQFVSLLGCAYLFVNKAPKKSFFLAIFLVISPPFLLFLVSAQKASLLPALALTTSFIILYECQKNYSLKKAIYALIPLYFAMGCKYSLILQSFSLFCFGGWLSFKNKDFKNYFLINCLFLVGFYGPLFSIKVYLFEDPLSPFLEGLKENPKTYLVDFVNNNLKSYQDSPLIFPLRLIIPYGLGKITTIFGLSFFAILFLRKIFLEKKEIFYFLLFNLILTLIFSQKNSRFFHESYLFMAFAIINLDHSKFKDFFSDALAMQSLAILPLYLFGVFTLFPGAFGQNQRTEVLKRSGYHYNFGSYLKTLLKSENEKVLMHNIASSVYFNPKNFIHGAIIPALGIEKKKGHKAFVELLKKEDIKIITSSSDWSFLDHFSGCFKEGKNPLKKAFPYETRNPFNKSKFVGHFYFLKDDLTNCRYSPKTSKI